MHPFHGRTQCHAELVRLLIQHFLRGETLQATTATGTEGYAEYTIEVK